MTGQVLSKQGAKEQYWKPGNYYIKLRVNEVGALAGFEKSGHFFFNGPLGRGYDDGLRFALAVCDMLDRNPGKSMADLKNALPKTWSSPTMSPHCADEAKYGVVERVVKHFETAQSNHGPLRALVNNAGIAIAGPLEYLPVEELRRQFEINVFAPIAVAQAFLPLLRESRGRIICVGSIAGRLSAPCVGPYSSSKAALASLVDALRQELASTGVAVSLLEFAAVKTPIWAKGRESKDEMIAKLPPLAMTHYGHVMDAVVKQTQHEERHGMEPSVIAQTILAALRAARPRERYVIGKQAKVQSVAALLPPRTRDRLIRKAMNLPS